jgi:uncharacterized protein (TIGR02145 family)
LPTEAEWTKLITYLGGDDAAGSKMKTTIGWKADVNTKSTNGSGFSALPAGYRYNTTGKYEGLGEFNTFWTATPYNNESALAHDLSYTDNGIASGYYKKGRGYTVRCIKD